MSLQKYYRLLFIWLCIALCFSFDSKAEEPSSIGNEELLRVVQNEVSGERAWDWVSKISRYHRIRGGGEGSDYNRCVEWLAQELEKMGIQEINIHLYKADGFTKSFLWNSLIGWRVKEAELWLVEPVKKLVARFSDQAVSLMPYSQGGEVEADVVFVGEGKAAQDYQDKDIKEKLVFAVGGGGTRVHRLAAMEREAAGVIVGPSNREYRLPYVDLIELNRLSFKGKERDKARFGFSLSRRQTQEILSYFQAGQNVRMKAKVDAELFDGNMPILEAVIPGKDIPEQEIIVMGHLDHYKPGANDNASGSAGMMEMVRNIVDLVRRGDIPPLKRTMRFLWVPEMHGTAPYLVEHENIDKRGIAGMNLDMIGEDNVLCQTTFNLIQSPYSVPGYINDIMINLLGWLEGREFFSPRGSRNLFNPRVLPYSGGSDHIMFNDAFIGIPTPMLGHGDIFHHTNFDTPDKCDPTEMKRIISLALASSLILANATDESALKIAREVYSQASLRMAKRTQKSLQLLHETASNPEKRHTLAELYANVSTYPRYLAEIETANISEVKELCRRKHTEQSVDNLASGMKSIAEQESQKLEKAFGIILGQYDIPREIFKPDKSSKTASSLIPQRLFKGPLPSNILEERLSAADMEWFRTNGAKAGRYASSKMYEMVNLMNGQRSVLDIRHLISCEFDETNTGFVLRMVQILENAGLIKYR
ncbi:DUF4910 domain-containing protein [Acidobacteriota bacterium]